MIKTVKELAELVKGEIAGDGSVKIHGVNRMTDAAEGEISFLGSKEHAQYLSTTKASCLVVPKGHNIPFDRPMIKVDHPSIAFSAIVNTIIKGNIPHPKGIHPSSVVSNTAKLGANVSVGAHAVICDGAVIGDNTVIYPSCYIGTNASIGSGSLLYPNVIIRENITVGNRVMIHGGSVIGSDGFGYDTGRDGSHVKIPQIGTVIIEDDVEIGACTTIDRARFGRTLIGKGTKIDNLVQIAHNVEIGPYCLIAAQTGISGSTKLGRNVVLAGGVGMADHITLGDFCVAGGMTGITRSYPAKTTLFWYPARPVDKVRDVIASIGLLPKLFKKVRELEKKIKELEKR